MKWGPLHLGGNGGHHYADEYVPDDITLSGATIDNSVIGGTTPAVATVTIITANEGIVPDESVQEHSLEQVHQGILRFISCRWRCH